eukprot:CAMPEP_0183731318 /NCGR_PEP_ID=MMETSP0737-20130205/35020_1 /TAXON_ID=385413 /ORGANISM="Thalassiosira miniscula, Strain CCMP1093" /LENGTH=57 /DNA_ID=CAMNT_0025964015 /DNA_START=32 /DNA_END=202 /DNA_ORIENTATION=-
MSKNWVQTSSGSSSMDDWMKADTASRASSSDGSSIRMERIYSEVSSSICWEREGVEE